MGTNWLDVTALSFNSLLLLERVQLSWFPKWSFPRPELALALQANPAVTWYLRHKCPEIEGWLDEVVQVAPGLKPAALGSAHLVEASQEQVRQAEIAVMHSLDDLLTYAVDPSIYDAQPFLNWDSQELAGLVDFSGKTVIDVGSGTGRLAFVAAERARAVFPVEPVENLRRYLRQKTARLGFDNVYPVDGLITEIPFPDAFADVTTSGHVFGDDPEAEQRELVRVTASGGMVILCPGTNDRDSQEHRFLVECGYAWAAFEEPGAGMVRKYWKVKDGS